MVYLLGMLCLLGLVRDWFVMILVVEVCCFVGLLGCVGIVFWWLVCGCMAGFVGGWVWWFCWLRI